MAEEQQGQEKTEEATPRKLEKAKEEGQVARSRELSTVMIVTFGAVALAALMPFMTTQVMDLAVFQFSTAAKLHQPLQHYLADAGLAAFLLFLPLSTVLFVAAIASSIAVGGLVMSPKAMQPKLSRLSLIKGFGRIFSAKSLVELVKSIAKFVLISGVTIAVLAYLFSDLLVLGSFSVEGAIAQALQYVAIAFVLVGLVLILVAAIDIPFQIYDHKKQLKMTKQEVKDEMKDSEGKPEVKAKLRALQQQVAQRKMLEDVPQADVVITNPEHYSVAVRYQAGQDAAPMMLAKGVDFMAMKIREIADAHDIPQVQAPPLARAIYFNTEVGDEIPEDLYVAVAQVLAYVYQLERYRRGQLAQAPSLGNVDVPSVLDPESEDE